MAIANKPVVGLKPRSCSKPLREISLDFGFHYRDQSFQDGRLESCLVFYWHPKSMPKPGLGILSPKAEKCTSCTNSKSSETQPPMNQQSLGFIAPFLSRALLVNPNDARYRV